MGMDRDPQRPDEIDLGAYLAGLRRQKVLIVVITLIGLALGLAYSQIKTPTYTATATVQVTPSSDQSSNASELLATEEIVAGSMAVADIAATEAAPSSDPATLLKRLSVSRGLGDANVLQFRYSSTSPALARAGADAFAHAYVTFKEQQAAQGYQELRSLVQGQINDLTKRIETLNRKIASLPRNSGQHNAIRATVSSLSDQISELRTRLAQALPVGAEQARVIEAADLPSSPVSPDPLVDAIAGLMIGFFTGIVVALVRSRRGERWRGAVELEEWLGAPVLGMIPKTAERREVVTIREPKSPAAEGYRKLRARLFLIGSRPTKTLMVTSPSSAEGKSAVATNIAVTLAQAGKRTILVSADFRRPGVDRLLDLRPAPGFSEVLSGESALSTALQPSVVQNLWVLSSGRSSSADIDVLHSDSIEEFLRVGDLVDYIVIDAAPVVAVADALVLAGWVDGVVIVGNGRHVPREEAIRARQELERVGAHLLGIIVTQAPHGHGAGDGGYGWSRPDSKTDTKGGATPERTGSRPATAGRFGGNGRKDADAEAWLQQPLSPPELAEPREPSDPSVPR